MKNTEFWQHLENRRSKGLVEKVRLDSYLKGMYYEFFESKDQDDNDPKFSPAHRINHAVNGLVKFVYEPMHIELLAMMTVENGIDLVRIQSDEKHAINYIFGMTNYYDKCLGVGDPEYDNNALDPHRTWWELLESICEATICGSGDSYYDNHGDEIMTFASLVIGAYSLPLYVVLEEDEDGDYGWYHIYRRVVQWKKYEPKAETK